MTRAVAFLPAVPVPRCSRGCSRLTRRRPRRRLVAACPVPHPGPTAAPRALAAAFSWLPQHPPAAGLQSLAIRFAKFWKTLGIARGDVVLALACMILPSVLLRVAFRLYGFLLRRLDPEGIRLHRPETYRESMFHTVEHAGLLQLAGALSLSTMGLRLLFASAKRMGVSDPVHVKGGTPLRFRKLSTVFFWAFALSKVKKKLLLRGDALGIRNSRQRFVLDRASDALIAVLLALASLEILNLPLSSLAAAGGIGGLVVGLASKELVENVFGGISLLFTSPFDPGDYVTSSAFSGRIDRIGFYTTRLTDFDGASAVVPNSRITNAVVTNISRTSRRRFNSRYSLRYDDLQAAPHIAASVREKLRAHPLVDKGGYVRSHLTSFGPYSLVLEAKCLVLTKSLDAFLDFQQEAMLMISEAVNEYGAEFKTEFPPLLERDSTGAITSRAGSGSVVSENADSP